MPLVFSLKPYGITVADVLRNPPVGRLYELGVADGDIITANGALAAFSGTKTGRSPKDKRIVDHPKSTHDVWWGPVNIKLPESSFLTNRQRAIDYLNTRQQVYCLDGFAGWDPQRRLKVRVICARPYHALFMHNMLIRPDATELAAFGDPDYVIYNAGQFPANNHTVGMTSQTSICVSFERGEMIILGTEYAGEMKKGVFTDHALSNAEARCAFDALFGQRRRSRRCDAVLWPFGNRQDNAFCRSAAPTHRRRRTLLERRRCVQYRRRLLRQVRETLARKRARDL